MEPNAERSRSIVSHRAPVWRLIQSLTKGPRYAERSRSMVGFRLEWLDYGLAHPVARDHLDFVGHQLGRSVVLVRANEETRDDRGVAQVPLPHSLRGHSLFATDWEGPGGKDALAVWQCRHIRGGVSCPCRDIVHMVGENSSRTILVERDHAQGRPSGH